MAGRSPLERRNSTNAKKQNRGRPSWQERPPLLRNSEEKKRWIPSIRPALSRRRIKNFEKSTLPLCDQIKHDGRKEGPRDLIVYKDVDGHPTRAYRRKNHFHVLALELAKSASNLAVDYTHSEMQLNQLRAQQMATDNALIYYVPPSSNPWANMYDDASWQSCLELTLKMTQTYTDPNWCLHRGLLPYQRFPELKKQVLSEQQDEGQI